MAQPTVTGTFGKTPLLHILVSLLERSSTGTLVVETTDLKRSALYLDRGVPAKLRLGEPQALLGEVLVQMGYLKNEVAKTTYEEAAKTSRLHGQILVSEGLMDEELLRLALRTQLIQKLQVTALLPPETVFGFYEGTDYLAKWRAGPTPVSPLAAAWALAQHRADPKTVAMMIGRITGHPLRLHRKSITTGFGFGRDEQGVIDVLRAKPQTLESLQGMRILSPDRLERMAYVLTLTRHLDFGRDLQPLGVGAVAESDEAMLDVRESLRPSRPVVLGAEVAPLKTEPQPLPRTLASKSTGATEPESSKQAPPSTRSLERRAQFEKMAQGLETKNYFELFGVERDAGGPAIQEVFLKLAKTYHPDRLPEDAGDLRALATRIFARLSEALPVLTDPVRRKAYVQTLDQGPVDDEEEKIRRVLRAAGNFHRAEVLLKKRMLAAAELEINRAVEDDPDQPDYLALCAWIQSCKPDSDARLPELIKQISDAILHQGDSEKNRYYRVQLLKRLGRIEEAVADCRVIVDRNPHHVDALREIRLWEMRRPPKNSPQAKAALTKTSSGKHHSPPPTKPASPGSTPPNGLLGRLFKR